MLEIYINMRVYFSHIKPIFQYSKNMFDIGKNIQVYITYISAIKICHLEIMKYVKNIHKYVCIFLPY